MKRKGFTMRLTMLGTGHALATKCYNACFALQDDATRKAPGRTFLVDAGGGNGILTQLERAGIDWHSIHDLFVTHTHVDHLLGSVWILRVVCYGMECGNYQGEFHFWGNDEVVAAADKLAHTLLRPSESAFIGKRVFLHAVKDGDTTQILGRPVTFFDIHSTGSAKQFGFAMEYSAGKVLACSGDEPLTSENFSHVEGATWLVHEAYCRHVDIDRYNPHPIHHGTVREACATAEHLSVENLVLYHTEDDDLAHRKERYLAEGRSVYGGNLHVPDDLEAFEL